MEFYTTTSNKNEEFANKNSDTTLLINSLLRKGLKTCKHGYLRLYELKKRSKIIFFKLFIIPIFVFVFLLITYFLTNIYEYKLYNLG